MTAAHELKIDRMLNNAARRAFKKTCSCGAKYSWPEFVDLPSPPGGDYQEDKFEDQVGLLLRNCPKCSSTLACPVMSNGDVLV